MEDLVQAAELTEETGGGLESIAGTKSELKDSLKEEVKFQAALTFNDFAVQCSCRGLHAEAAQLLNQAIEKEKSQAALYLNRGGEEEHTSVVHAHLNAHTLGGDLSFVQTLSEPESFNNGHKPNVVEFAYSLQLSSSQINSFIYGCVSFPLTLI